ncbi:MAG: hypothetical protein A2W93_02385 [Bacteroidetes bacterium GWF2_43_63]|nr:MAG: hypothetical protein A2W94_08390 [Bacteroidetes bacterium GWE2_42_42]OFY53522.1 MAG: hypothetical protein A2W93_02385 [Bacteroidetes bacterium GWF2_43_63]HBG71153.1 hypothetical protein [Bacteroidales bacterium]HCB63731.1 hypothetical protein [Bacteroidales bacterium]HCY24480.1 hypothetical protein [Bacteroidales bacterium]
MKALISLNYHGRNFIYIMTLCISSFFSGPTFGQAPDIGTDSSFALFTAAGDFNNTGSTIIWGDAGTNVGAYTGSPTVMGEVHVADIVAAQAAVDVSAAYSFMTGLICDSTITTPFGNGLVLGPGKVYCLTTASALNGDLILDAKGDPSGIFIIKINGALSTSPSSKVILKNAASFCNVYWQVVGAVDLGENSIFRGTIIADGAISLLDGASLDGRGLSRAGAITLNGNMVVGCDANGDPMPIVLTSFEGQSVGSSIQLNWSTATETNNDYFTIQRSNDAVSFQDLLRIEGAGNSNVIHQYSAIDLQPFDGAVFYRLMQTDFDGTTTFSDVIVVHFAKTTPFTVFPNPFSTSATFVLDDMLIETKNFELKIYNVMGKEMMSSILTDRLTTLATGDLTPGIYLYKITSNGEMIQSGRLISE